MFCSNCGKEVEGKFCSECGAPTSPKQQPSDSTEKQWNAAPARPTQVNPSPVISVQHTQKFYEQSWLIVLLLIFITPFGLALMWGVDKFKKTTRIVLTIIFSLYFIGLSATIISESAKTGDSIPVSTAAPSSESAVAKVEAPKEEQPATPDAAADEGALGDYYIKIKTAQRSTDYEGKDCVAITFDFTNNDEETTSYGVSLTAKAFQDGVELDRAILAYNNELGLDSASNYKDVKKGACIEVCDSWILSSDSPIEVEVTQFISLDNTTITKTFELK